MTFFSEEYCLFKSLSLAILDSLRSGLHIAFHYKSINTQGKHPAILLQQPKHTSMISSSPMCGVGVHICLGVYISVCSVPI